MRIIKYLSLASKPVTLSHAGEAPLEISRLTAAEASTAGSGVHRIDDAGFVSTRIAKFSRYLIIFCALSLLMSCAHGNLATNSSHERSSNAVKPQGRPSVEIPETSYDFGKIGKQSIVSHDFKIRNTGTAPLEIKRVESL